jgi:hypothetical protein
LISEYFISSLKGLEIDIKNASRVAPAINSGKNRGIAMPETTKAIDKTIIEIMI